MFIVLDCISFFFGLVYQKMFEMELKKWSTSQFLSSSIWKQLFVKILIYHINLWSSPQKKNSICDIQLKVKTRYKKTIKDKDLVINNCQ
jgi:hypothetical protein